ncbi:MAG: LapA family protein [Pedobacter sp.]|nr:MAG: LapA family protein [Pedobacter sp.]
MKAKTIFIILSTGLITVFLMLNTDRVDFDFLFADIAVSKLLVIGVCSILGFLLGYLAGKPKTIVTSYDPRFENDTEENDDETKDRLSKEDRDYIS